MQSHLLLPLLKDAIITVNSYQKHPKGKVLILKSKATVHLFYLHTGIIHALKNLFILFYWNNEQNKFMHIQVNCISFSGQPT